MLNFKYILLFLILLSSCSKNNAPSTNDSLLNTSHLEHLYQEVEINNTHLGTIWIYCDAPDYQLVADDDEGFTCVDDVARTLVFYCRQYKDSPDQEILNKIKSFTRFLLYMKANNGYFYNFMFPDEAINTTHTNSLPIPNFWSWRAFWAFSELNLLDSPELDSLKTQTTPIIEDLINKIDQIFISNYSTVVIDGIEIPSWIADQGADQIALIMMSLTNYYQVNKSSVVYDLLLRLGNSLIAAQYGNQDKFPHYAFLSWKNIWHAWGNTQAYALLYTGRIIQNNQFINAGLNEVDHFYPYCLERGFVSQFKIIYENDSITESDFQSFPQIAYGITPMVFASLEAYIITGDESYANLAGDIATWFFGNNSAGQLMYDHATGKGFDGIDSASKINYNSGAESTIEALLSIQAIESNYIAKGIVKNYK